MKTIKSQKQFKKALNYFPGGVNSPVRAFRSVGGTPLFMEKGKGSRIGDADGNTYLDFCSSWGPLIHGHAHPAVQKSIVKAVKRGTSFGAPTIYENELADLIVRNNRFVERLRFVSSGTEAVMSAIRLARGVTGRSLIVKFDGCYHGHSDSLLVKAGSGLVTFGTSSSAGVPASFVKETLVLSLDDRTAVERTFKKYGRRIACVIIEPVPANNGLLLQEKSFLQLLRDLCTRYGSLLIFDEVISGFRLGFEGAAGYYGITPDIVTYGKIIGGGMPVGAYGGSRKIMSHISPEGPVYQAGTLSGNPVAMAAGIAQLKQCLKKNFYKKLEKKTRRLADEINLHASANNYPVRVFSLGSIFWFSFSKEKTVRKASQISSEGIKLFNKFYHLLLNRGIYLGPSGYEVGFVSSAHSDKDMRQAARTVKLCLDWVFSKR